MGWSQRFLNAIRGSTIAPMWQLRTVPNVLQPKPVTVVSSHPTLSGLPVIARDGVQITGEEVEPLTWNATHGGFSLTLASGANLDGVMRVLRRGALVQLYMGFPGWAEADFEPVALGMVDRISHTSRVSWRVEVAGLGTVLASRLDRVSGKSSLFHDLPVSTTLAGNFADSATTMDVTDSTGFERETGGNYCLLVTPTTGDPFYVLATGLTGNQFTGITASTAALGTTRVSAVTNDTVEAVAYIAGHPCDVARKILCSTGAGTNGAYDTLPDSWGIGVPDALVDHNDIAATVILVQPGTGSWNLQLTSVEPATDPGAWLKAALAQLGMWLTLRQGQITIRAARVPFKTPRQPVKDLDLDVGPHIIQNENGVESHEYYHPSWSVEYGVHRVSSSDPTPTSTSTTDGDTVHLPAGDTYTLQPAIYGGTGTNSMRNEVKARTDLWPLRTPEDMSIVTAGWVCARLCPGDIVPFTTTRRVGRREGSASTGGRFEARKVFVAGVSKTISSAGFTTTLRLAILPETKA